MSKSRLCFLLFVALAATHQMPPKFEPPQIAPPAPYYRDRAPAVTPAPSVPSETLFAARSEAATGARG
jgi:hypothetical protein